MSDAEIRRFWRLSWLSALQAFADRDTQQRRWLDPKERNPSYSFVECMADYFDGAAYLGQEDAYRKRLEWGHLSKAEAHTVAGFHALADAYQAPCDEWDAATILADPAWQEVVASAEWAQQKLLPLLSGPDEIEALTQPPLWSEKDGSYYARLPGTAIIPAAREKRGLRAMLASIKLWLVG
ncbi:hypothetical protein [Stakelama tenebrarum]|uniref:Uncharacterized protein n=1 Tax=Stakelama tenebrarum TaxID=2711215 RepID=A0A6G6Y9B2_9SPHN|nr:hypothetical protein [Sphingosinithalassobacter tenebrarum]QIG81163.1 hypothetical protein G5C33_16190 [Sphingosinithalassobacter tenebrarum]